jgi:hypothetical protein
MDFNSQFSILNSQFSIQLVDWRSSKPSPCWPQIVVDFSEIQRRTSERSATIAKDFEGLVLDRTQFRKDRTTANPTSFVVLDLWLRDAHPVQFPVDVVPAKRQRFRRRPTLLGKPMHET